jgi:membrane fusion protein (multidrug efflux system)
MKKLIYSLLGLALLAACAQVEQTDIDKLKAEKDSLGTVAKEVALRMKEIESTLAELDSTVRVNAITAVLVEPQDFSHYFTVYGTVESNKSINLYAESSGQILSINVKRGQNVARGQLLAELDGSVLKQNVVEVEKSLELAKELYEKQSKLWIEDKIGSEVQYLEAKNRKESLETRLETLKAQLAMTRVRAPFSGVIDDIFPKVGEMASPQMPMFRLVNLNDVYLTAAVSEAYVGKIKTGTPAHVTFSSVNEKFDTEVVRVGSFINPDNRTFDVNVSLKENNELKPNMMGAVNLEDYTAKNALVVPSRLILESPNGDSYIYIFEGTGPGVATVTKRMIEAGLSYKGKTEILSGLTGGELVVDKGSRSVKDGQQVRLVNEQ